MNFVLSVTGRIVSGSYLVFHDQMTELWIMGWRFQNISRRGRQGGFYVAIVSTGHA